MIDSEKSPDGSANLEEEHILDLPADPDAHLSAEERAAIVRASPSSIPSSIPRCPPHRRMANSTVFLYRIASLSGASI